MSTPKVGDIWVYDTTSRHCYSYLVLKVEHDVATRCLLTELLCLDDGKRHTDYTWPNDVESVWKQIA